MEEPIAKKAYYSIGDVCGLTGLKPHVLRYWESQFEVLHPTKNRAGNRVYRPKDIELILLVKHLLLELKREGALRGEQHDIVGTEFLSGVKRELQGLLSILTPPASSGD